MKKKLSIAIIACAMLLMIFAPMTAKAEKPGWEKGSDGYWYYYTTSDSSSYYKSGIFEIGSESYYFDAKGRMLTGWIKNTYTNEAGEIFTTWYYAKSSGVLAYSWEKIGGVWYYFSPSGYYMYSGGIYWISGNYYYFYPSGAMGSGWIKETGSYYGYDWVEWYYANSSGALLSGWQNIGGVWYYFDTNNHTMFSNGVYEIGGASYFFYPSGAMGTGWCKLSQTYYDGSTLTNWFYANSSGALQKGWQTIGGVKYYFDPYSFEMTVGSKAIDEKYYVFQSSGALVTTAGWQKVIYGDGTVTWYYTKADGTPMTGWQKIGGVWYYFYPGGAMVCGTTTAIDGGVYYFDENGALASTEGWKKVTYPNRTFWVYTYADGTVKTGWFNDGGTWYYFNGYGHMFNAPTIIDGKINMFDSSGAWTGYATKGWVKNDNYDEWYYCVDSNGTPKTGWLEYNGKYYYLNPTGYFMLSGSWYGIDGKYYYFYNNGVMGTGWIKDVYTYSSGYTETTWYYADSSGALQSKWQTINGVKYYFHPDYFYMYADGYYTIDSVTYYFDANGACLWMV